MIQLYYKTQFYEYLNLTMTVKSIKYDLNYSNSFLCLHLYLLCLQKIYLGIIFTSLHFFLLLRRSLENVCKTNFLILLNKNLLRLTCNFLDEISSCLTITFFLLRNFLYFSQHRTREINFFFL